MNVVCWPFAAIALLASAACVAQPIAHTIAPSAVATAVDQGPANGVFDTLIASGANLGMVNNNGYIEDRTALVFPRPAVGPAARFVAARLVFTLWAWEGPRGLAVYAYPSSSTPTLRDFTAGGRVATRTVGPGGSHELVLDVGTAYSGMPVGTTHAGFTVREEPPNAPNYTIMRIEVSTPRLLIEYVLDPDLVVTLASRTPLMSGQLATKVIQVANAGPGSTHSEPVRVTMSLDPALRPVALDGVGWQCDVPQLQCERSDPLDAGLGFPPILLGVVAAPETTGSTTTISAAASGGGDRSPANNAATLTDVVLRGANEVPALGAAALALLGLIVGATAAQVLRRRAAPR